MKKLTITIFLTAVVLNLSYGQNKELQETYCTLSHDRALFDVQYYLTASDLKGERIKSGTDNIPIEQVRHVDNNDVCIKLNVIVNSNEKFKKIDEAEKRIKFFYQTDEFYFIFWDYADRIPRLGPKKIFIVINKMYEVVGVFYV